jgi:hypothetical protein
MHNAELSQDEVVGININFYISKMQNCYLICKIKMCHYIKFNFNVIRLLLLIRRQHRRFMQSFALPQSIIWPPQQSPPPQQQQLLLLLLQVAAMGEQQTFFRHGMAHMATGIMPTGCKKIQL